MLHVVLKTNTFDEVKAYIEQGWEYVKDFPCEKAIEEFP